jgi:hypothetical protein
MVLQANFKKRVRCTLHPAAELAHKAIRSMKHMSINSKEYRRLSKPYVGRRASLNAPAIRGARPRRLPSHLRTLRHSVAAPSVHPLSPAPKVRGYRSAYIERSTWPNGSRLGEPQQDHVVRSPTTDRAVQRGGALNTRIRTIFPNLPVAPMQRTLTASSH